MSSLERLADGITSYTKTVILIVLLLTVLVGAGATMVEQDSGTEQFETDSEASDAQAYIEENLTIQQALDDDDEDEFGFGSIVQLIQRGDNVLSQDSLVEALELQQRILDDEQIAATLDPDEPPTGIPNAIGDAAIAQQGGDVQTATMEDRIAAIEQLDDEQLEGIILSLLGEDADPEILGLMPASYEPGSTTATAQSMVITQQPAATDGPGFDPELTDAQLEIRSLANDADSEYAVFGAGILGDEIDQSLGDSAAIVGPLALTFVILALAIAYRDILDIVLGVFGILLVLIWTFGFMGWANISFNQLLLSVPVLLIGLSIDYAIHVFMRYREQREQGGGTEALRRPMAIALTGVGGALVWVTATAALGFLANLTSPIGPLQDFGIVSAFGVVAALIVFGALIPALKLELDGWLEARGFNRHKRAFGTGESRFSSLLASGATAARRAPIVIIVLAVLLTAGGAYGASQVDTSFDEQDFIADSPPDWTNNLPGPMAPGTYQINEDIEFIGDNYQQEDNEAEVLIRGEVTDDQVLQVLADTSDEMTAEFDTLFDGPEGVEITSPLTIMQETAAIGAQAPDPAEDPEGAAEFTEEFQLDPEAVRAFAEEYNRQVADSDGDVPTQNVERLYDLLLAANPAQASQFIYQNDEGEYEALRLEYGILGGAGISELADENREAASIIERQSGSSLTAVAASDQVIFDNVQEDLLDTVIQGLIITLVSVFLFLSVAYKLTGSPASLGVVTLMPVAMAVAWILGSMWLLDIPFNTLTGTITSLTIGLGIAYSIHISSRYQLELGRQGDAWDAMQTTVTGTGGALLGSAATTVGGFGTLAFAILPLLRQFGIITGLTIIYAFLASVLVLPSLLILWTRYFGPPGVLATQDDDEAMAEPTDDDATTPDPSATDAETPEA